MEKPNRIEIPNRVEKPNRFQKPVRFQLGFENLLGLEIYQAVLAQYMEPSRIDLKALPLLLPNPFRGFRESLILEAEDGKLVHWDLQEERLQGDAFDFAQLHFGAESMAQLLPRLVHDLQLSPQPHWPKKRLWHPRFSAYKAPVRNVLPAETLDLQQVYERIKGDTYAEITARLRALKTAKERREFKARAFDYVTFGGIFNQRRDADLKQASGLLVLDFDDLGKRLKASRELLCRDREMGVELVFTSPSGNGLKVVLRYDLDGPWNHQDYFTAMSRYVLRKYNLEADKSGRDISRACFICQDPEIWKPY